MSCRNTRNEDKRSLYTDNGKAPEATLQLAGVVGVTAQAVASETLEEKYSVTRSMAQALVRA